MGRRSKTKQPDPAPLESMRGPRTGKSAQKGKRTEPHPSTKKLSAPPMPAKQPELKRAPAPVAAKRDIKSARPVKGKPEAVVAKAKKPRYGGHPARGSAHSASARAPVADEDEDEMLENDDGNVSEEEEVPDDEDLPEDDYDEGDGGQDEYDLDEGEEDEEDEEEDEEDDEDEKEEPKSRQKPARHTHTNQGKVPARKQDAKPPKAQETEVPSTEDFLASLGLPKKGGKLSERQKKKALAEAERLELLLKSSGHSLEDDQGEEAPEGEDDDEVPEDEEEEGEVEEEEPEEEEPEEEVEGEGEEEPEDEVEEEPEEGLDEIPEEELEGADDEELGEDGLEPGEDEFVGEEGDEEAPDDGFLLPTVEQEEEEKKAPLDLQLIHMRIQEVVNILSDLPRLGQPGRSRADYLDRLLRDVQTYYGYNEFLAEILFNLFPPAEAIEFFEANETPRPVTIRANTLKTRRRDLAQKLINRGVTLEPVGSWSKVGLQVFESSVPIGATPEYLVGDYMLQAVSSFLPCIALAPQPNERVLDMASAPGGKATYLSALMQNTGCVFANDSNKARIKSLTANVHRMGCKNVIVSNYDGRQFPKVIGGFDRVLLDSPCSGTGVISKDPSVKTNKSKRDLILLTQLQKQLILCAIDSVNPKHGSGGYVVYSTCSVTVEENEEVVEYALRKRPNVRIVPTGLEFGREGFKSYRGKKFTEKMVHCRRIFPHVHNLDGFFVCKLKVEPVNKGAKRQQELAEAELDQEASAGAPVSRKAAEMDEVDEESPFQDAEDEAIMQRARERHAKKRKTT